MAFHNGTPTTDRQRKVAALLSAGIPAPEAIRLAGYPPGRGTSDIVNSRGVQEELARLAKVPMSVTTQSVTIPTWLLDGIGRDAAREGAQRILNDEELEDRAAAVLTRGWVISRMMRAAQMALGEAQMIRRWRKFRQKLDDNGEPAYDDEGQPEWEITTEGMEAIEPDLNAAGRHLNSLLQELNRMDPMGLGDGAASVEEHIMLVDGRPADPAELAAPFQKAMEELDDLADDDK